MLAEYEDALVHDIAFWSASLFDDDMPLVEVARLSRELVPKYRALAILKLLTAGDPDSFHHNLIRSARIRIICLERVAATPESGIRVWGQHRALTDAIASGDVNLVTRMSELLPGELREGFEYEEEHRFARAMALALPPGDRYGEVALHLERLESLEGSTARVSVLQAIVDGDADAFDEALEAFVSEHEERFRERREATAHADPVVLAESEVCVEALAFLQLAGWRGIDTDGFTYRLVPPLARRPMQSPYPGDL